MVHGLNFILSHRKEDQDFINFEYDYRLHDKNFVQHFWETHQAFPEMAAISAIIYPIKHDEIRKIISKHKGKHPSHFTRNCKEVFLDYLLGYCLYIPYETMNEIRYYNEVDCFGDVELNLRFRGMGKTMGYAMDIHVSHSKHGGDCDTCLAYKSPCPGYDKARVPKCLKYYYPLVARVMDEIGMYEKYSVIRKLADVDKVFPTIRGKSVFDEKPDMTTDELIQSRKIMEMFKNFTSRIYRGVAEHDKT